MAVAPGVEKLPGPPYIFQVQRAARPARAADWLWRRRYAALSFIAAFGLWEVAVRLLNVAPYLLPPPSTIVAELLTRWPRVMDSAVITTQEILAGYLLAVVVSVPLALLIAYSRALESTIYPLIVFLQIVPKIAIAPLFIIWFGFGFTPKLLLVFLLSFFPIVVSSIAGFKSLDPEVMDLARSTGAVPCAGSSPRGSLGRSGGCATKRGRRPRCGWAAWTRKGWHT